MCCVLSGGGSRFGNYAIGTPRWWWLDLRAVDEKFYQYTLAAIENSSSLATGNTRRRLLHQCDVAQASTLCEYNIITPYNTFAEMCFANC